MTQLQHQLTEDFNFLARERERLAQRMEQMGLAMLATLPVTVDQPVIVDRHYGWVLRLRVRTSVGVGSIEMLYNTPTPKGERSRKFRTVHLTVGDIAERVEPWDGVTFDPALHDTALCEGENPTSLNG
jgi:hypothetical protein